MDTTRSSLIVEGDILATVFDVARIGICVIDQDGRFEHVNPAFCQMLGYRLDELVGAHYAIAAPPEIAAAAEKFLLAVLADSAKIPKEWQIRRKDQSLFDSLVSFKPVTRANGRRYVVVTFSDISDSKQAQQEIERLNRGLEIRIAERTAELERKITALKQTEYALKVSEASTHLIIDTAQDAVVTMDARGLVTRWNQQAEQLFGWTKEQAVGHRLSELIIPARLRAQHEAGYRRFLATHERRLLNRTVEVPLLHRDGREITVELTVWPIKIGDDYEFGSFIRDITARKLADAVEKSRTQKLLLYRERLYDLARLNKTEFDRALAETLAVSAKTLEVARVSYWRFSEDLTQIERRALYRLDQAKLDESAVGATAEQRDHPRYFAAIVGNRPIVANRAQEHADTGEFTLSYLVPNGITSMLDTPVWFRGDVVGVLCHEHLGAARDWTPEEVDFATAVANMISLALEASSRKQAEIERQQSEQKYRRVIDLSNEGFWLIDAHETTVEVNDALCRMLGYSRAEMLGRKPYEFLDRENQKRVGWWLRHSQSQSVSHEIAFIAKDGHVVSTILNVTRIRADRRQDDLTFAFVTDVTEVLRLQENLQRSLSEREAILQSSLVGIVFLKDNHVQWANRTLEQMLGYGSGELSGASARTVYPSEADYSAISKAGVNALARGESYATETQMKRKDGSLFWCHITGRALDFTNLTAGTIWILMDVTERRQAEQEILRALAREKELNELKSRFVSMTSHEFRTPLTTILSSIELLRDYGDRLPNVEKNELMAVIKTSVNRMTEMLDDILVIGKAEAGALEFRPAPLAVSDFCRRVIDELRMTASDSHEFQFSYSGPECEHVVDEKLLRHILNNLLSNAVKYSPHGGLIRTEVTCTGQEIVLTIGDSGIGIPSEDQPELFQTFHRGKNVGNISGSGLGLAIVKKAVDLHSGAIQVASSIGNGTTFTVTIPATRPHHG